MLVTAVRKGVCRCGLAGARWLVTGHDGGYRRADAAYNVTVPEGFSRTDLAAYARERRDRAGFDVAGPALLTGVDQRHARLATAGPAAVLATVGLSNPAALPTGGTGGTGAHTDDDGEDPAGDRPAEDGDGRPSDGRRPGTVNLVVGVDRALADGPLAELLATCVEAKTVTLSALTGFPGTTSDAAAVGCRPDAEPAPFAGSATAVGAAARACVREAVAASLRSRYPETDWPATVAEADHGVRTDRRATVSRP